MYYARIIHSWKGFNFVFTIRALEPKANALWYIYKAHYLFFVESDCFSQKPLTLSHGISVADLSYATMSGERWPAYPSMLFFLCSLRRDQRVSVSTDGLCCRETTRMWGE